jgi:hypothetical protein
MYRNKKTVEMFRFFTGLVVDTEEELESFAADFGYTRKIGNIFTNDMNEVEIYRDEHDIVHIEEA